MKTQNVILLVASGLLFAGGCTSRDLRNGEDPAARFVVNFSTRTELADKPGFIRALKRAVWYRNISFAPPESNDPTGDHTGTVIATPTIVNATVSEDSQTNPSGLHVTQRVGFNRLADMKDLLDAIKQ